MTNPHALSPVGTASRDDLEAAALLDRNEANRLQLVRTRAEKWLGGLTALTGLVTTVLVIKGPQSTADIATSWKIGSRVAHRGGTRRPRLRNLPGIPECLRGSGPSR